VISGIRQIVDALAFFDQSPIFPSRTMDSQSQNRSSRDPTTAPSYFDQLGGEAALKAIVNHFIDRVFQDRMIGFFFRNADRKRLQELEYQLAAHFLGAPIEYQGRPLVQAHAKHPIMGGHFARRKQILKETLEFYAVPESIKAAWLQHTEDLRALITAQAGSECDPMAVRRNFEAT
jgi:hemoglobin